MKDKPKTRKDRLFIIVMAIIIANLTYTLLQVIPYLATGGYANIQAWALVVADIIGITGAFWLVRQERRRRKVVKTEE